MCSPNSSSSLSLNIEALQKLAVTQGQAPRDRFRDLLRYAGETNDLEDWLARANRIKEHREVLDAAAICECGVKVHGLAVE